MIEKVDNNKNAIIILHEIYGINKFIEEVCAEYSAQRFDVFCPDMIQRYSFLYSQQEEAYSNFIRNVGFEYYSKIEDLISKLKLTYEKVFIIGFSVGATIAWRCCEHPECDAIICCYGSRIRDYIWLEPSCPVLMLFARHDSFNVENLAEQLMGKENIELHLLEAHHGFMDSYSEYFSEKQAQIAAMHIQQFLSKQL
ncbi:dienelactone hydrolase family protein [Lutispora thermophila]|uniref:Dienelactone hydrolase n=1 Tax=Lutispora thermophila DSM 19022 TaxID=1122184 RepID=A0A1M6ILH3_9FIRM|nr:dienelactone hydrolase family protein [Lutispora thermophila]SHJ35237.1 Dienelactone hydrolase [Lutispora thermophila DSM 19022]